MKSLKQQILIVVTLLLTCFSPSVFAQVNSNKEGVNNRLIAETSKNIAIEEQRSLVAFEIFRQTCLANFMGIRSIDASIKQFKIKKISPDAVQLSVGSVSQVDAYDFSNPIGNFLLMFSEIKKGEPVCTIFAKEVDSKKFINVFQKNMPNQDYGLWVSTAKISAQKNSELQKYDLNIRFSNDIPSQKIGSMELQISDNSKAVTDVLSLTIIFGQ